jgi:hypothetical protein
MNKFYLVSSFVLVAGLIGCGGSGVSSVANPFKGSYSGTLSLDAGKQGALSINIAANGAATGTMQVTEPSRAAKTREGGGFSFSVGTINVSGTVGNDGTITMTGTDANSGLFNVNGSVTSSGGTINVVAGGETYTGTISISTSGGGSVTFSNGSGTNADLSPYPSNPFILTSNVGGSMSVVVALPGGNNARAFTFMLGTDAVAGSTINYATSLIPMFYTETGGESWIANGGTATVVSRGTGTFELQFNNVTFAPEAGTSGTGTFTINGSFRK